MLHLANGSLDSAPVRVVDVDILMSDCHVIRGYASKIALANETSLVLTPHGVEPTMGEDTTVDLEEAIWAAATNSDGTIDTFGAEKGELTALLTESFDGARAANQFGSEVAQLGIALGVVARAYGNLKLANRHFRDACKVLNMAQGNDRALADIWMRIAETFIDLDLRNSAKVAVPQAIAFYEHLLGVEHPITRRAKKALEKLS